MDDSRTKLVGPAIAVGAVSLGLIIIGACGVGQQDVYVPPPPLNADLAAAPARIADETTTTTTRVSIPPSPTWRIAPYMSPRKPFSLSSTETSPSEPPAEGETTESRPSEPTTESRPPTTTSDDHTTTPSTTTRPIPTLTTPPRIRPTVDDEEAAEPDYPTTHSHDNTTTVAPVAPADTGATPTPVVTTEAPTTTATPTTTDDER
ncbi:hypothetical protein ATM97_02245 [Nocardia sp. MH4]|uniref:hypothetical protein n=1 Tax=Nocardia TaxID=1817 RepID=UPI001C502367|nr:MULTISPECIES: hypothetical protein [Nocardia]MBW0269970.1 hypothetical protein [Nocardia sp. MH4]